MDTATDIKPAGYEYLQLCGKGRYGEVWLANELPAGNRVVLKIIRKNAENEEWRTELEGLRTYCATLAKMSPDERQHLVSILHNGENEHCFYYTMEPADNLSPLPGKYLASTLATRMQDHRLEYPEIVHIAQEILQALVVLRQHNIVHRDIKPENIFFFQGTARLGDIGLLATQADHIDLLGTPAFVPPELFQNADTLPIQGGEWDLYALGKVLYSMDTGLYPDNYPLTNNTNPRPELPTLVNLWTRMAAEKRSERLNDIQTIQTELDAIANSLAPRPRRLRRSLLYGAIAVVLLCLLGTHLFFRFTRRHHVYNSLLEAIEANDPAGVSARLKQGDSPRTPNPDGSSPLSVALHIPGISPAIVQELIARGAYLQIDPNAPDGALPTAIRLRQHPQIIHSLLLDTPRLDELLATPGCPLLFAAIDAHNPDVLRQLLEKSSAQMPDEAGRTPLMLALFRREHDLAHLLLEHGADPNAVDSAGLGPLHCIRNDDPAIVQELLKRGADLHHHAQDGTTPLLATVRAKLHSPDGPRVIRALLEAGAKADECDAQHITPLHEAIALGSRDVAELLLQNGANLEARTTRGFTPLHIAVLYRREDLCQWLLERGCSVAATDVAGRTPLHLAAFRNLPNIVKILLQASAIPEAKDKLALTPADLAFISSAKDALELLPPPQDKSDLSQRYRLLLNQFSLRRAPISPEQRQRLLTAITAKELNRSEILMALDGAPDLNPVKPDDPDFVRLAVDTGQLTILRSVLASYPKLDILGKDGLSPLQAAARSGRVDLCETLCAAGAQTNIHQGLPDWLDAAIQAKQPRTAYFAVYSLPDLLDSPCPEPLSKALPFALTGINQKWSPNSHAPHPILETWKRQGIFDEWDFARVKCLRLNTTAVRRALERGFISPNLERSPGEPLLADRKILHPMMFTLLHNGAQPNLSGIDGNTPLLAAIHARRQFYILKLLLDFGADPTFTPPNGKSAIDCAKTYGINAQNLMRFYIGQKDLPKDR
ncbi:MAG: ankyrin repeat domain-containing protein [Victivallales bacterium]|nr:ankyrin repeat domain-containing protein [Victivallales bacterium]